MNKPNKAEQEEKMNKEQEKEIIVDLCSVARYVCENVSTSTLSKDGKDSLYKGIAFAFPTQKVVITEKCYTYAVAKEIVRTSVMVELKLMSFVWYGEVYEAILRFLQKAEEYKKEEEAKKMNGNDLVEFEEKHKKNRE